MAKIYIKVISNKLKIVFITHILINSRRLEFNTKPVINPPTEPMNAAIAGYINPVAATV